MIPKYEQLHSLSRLWMHPNMERQQLLAFQTRKLRALVAHAYKNVTYYRRVFDRAGLKPEDIRSIGDLSAIPISTSRNLKKTPIEDILARRINRRKLVSHKSSGSSGRPFVIHRTALEEHLLNMFRIRTIQYFGMKISDRIANVTPRHRGKKAWIRRLRQSLGVYRDYPVSIFQHPESIISELDRLKPDIIQGYPGVLSHVAPKISKGNFRNIRPRMVITGGETLTPFRRRRIEKNFSTKVLDAYGAHEFNLLAWECESTGQYHICDDNVILEVIHDGKTVEEGESGEVVATGLNSYAMPFIRYCLDDIAVRGAETCPCGQPFSTVQSIQGRMRDYFQLPNGRRIHPAEIFLSTIVQEHNWIDEFQLSQKSKDRFLLRVAALRLPRQQELNGLKEKAWLKIGSDVEFNIELVAKIPFETSGKFRAYRPMADPEI
jgi:phenylacetate-coenzyme A ligase PaaK-like adenylate-forming protein